MEARAVGGVRVVQLADFAAPYPGSFIPALCAVRDSVEARGWTFEAVFPPQAEERSWFAEMGRSGIAVRVSPATPRHTNVLRLAQLLAEHDAPTILHSHFSRWDLPATLVARLPRPARRADPVVVIWHRHGTLGERPAPIARDVLRYAVIGRGIDANLCVGPAGYAELLARRSPRERTLLFPNGIDLARFRVGSAHERARARDDLGIEPSLTTLLAFVWDWNRKGGPLVIELVREFAQRGRPVLALLVGADRQADETARRLGVERFVRVLPPRADPSAYFYAADVFAAPSLHEALGFAPLEAVCCGTPVVASDVPGHRHFGAHLPALRLAPLRLGALADAIEAQLGLPPEERASRIQESRKYLAEHAGLSAWVERLLGVYDQALSRRGAAHRTPALAASSR